MFTGKKHRILMLMILAYLLILRFGENARSFTNVSSGYVGPILTDKINLDEALRQAINEHQSRPGVSFYYKEVGRTVVGITGVVYMTRVRKDDNETSSGPVDILGIEQINGKWAIWIPGDSNYQSFFDRMAPHLIDPSPFELYGDPTLVNPEDLTDYKLPWVHAHGARVTRTYNVGCSGPHGTGEIDFVVDAGDERIVASKNGTIIYANDSHHLNTASTGSWWYWNTVVIRHAANEYSTYAHLVEDSVPQWIKAQCSTDYSQANCSVPIVAGQVIGTQGDTGYAFGVHLHFTTGQTFALSTYTDNLDEDGDGDTSEPIHTRYGWSLQNISFIGYTSSQVANWSCNTHLQANNNQAPQLPQLNTPTANSWTNSTTVTWIAGSDDGVLNSSPDFSVQIDNNSDFSSPEVNIGWGYMGNSITASLAADNNYYWRVNQGDGALNSGWTAPRLFKLDRTLPLVDCTPGGPSSSNGWYNGTVTVSCSAHDNTGSNNSGIASTNYLLDGVPQIPPFQIGTEGIHTITYSATDNAGNVANGSELVAIDLTNPSVGTIAINNGASVTHSANVVVNFTYTETLSGPWEMCASLNQASWTCETFDTAMAFSLPNLNQTTHTVYFRIEDRAGNLSTVVSDSIPSKGIN